VMRENSGCRLPIGDRTAHALFALLRARARVELLRTGLNLKMAF
jgi:hypothetical protein